MAQEKISSIGKRVACAALRKLNENGGKMNSADLFAVLGKKLEIPSWAFAIYSTNGYAKWEHAARNQVIKFAEVGFLAKKSGVWTLTPEGEEFAAKSDAEILAEAAKQKAQKSADVAQADVAQADSSQSGMDVDVLDRFEGQARKGIADKIRKMGPYVFQDLVAALLRGMGYYVRHVASPGPDGGIDIVAYDSDPLGARGNRIKTQVKCRQNSAQTSEVEGLINRVRPGEIGVFVSTGGFASGCTPIVRSSPIHIDLIDAERFVELWCNHYTTMSDEDRARLPLRFIPFFDSERSAA